jgi:hypothetical protein
VGANVTQHLAGGLLSGLSHKEEKTVDHSDETLSYHTRTHIQIYTYVISLSLEIF